MGAQTGKKQNIFASETQILRLQGMLLGYANEETLGKHSKSVFLQCFPCDSSFVQDAENIVGKFQKHFLLPRRRFCVFNICCVGEQTRNHLGNTEETLTLNVSQMFPRLGT